VILIPSAPARRLTATFVALATVTAACGGDDAEPSDTTPATTSAPEEVTDQTADPAAPTATVGTTAALPIATTTIWADITSAVLCGAPVPAIVPMGSDPHTFEAPISARSDIAAAGFVVANGLDLEEGLLDLLAAVEDEGTVVVRMSDHLAVLAPSDTDEHGDEHGDDDEHDHDHSAGDPHVWLDPVRVGGALDAIVDAAVAAGHDATTISACAEAYRAELETLDEEIADMVTSVPVESRVLVTNHDALGYFADRYGFEVIGTVIPSTSTMASTNPAALADLAAVIEQAGVTTIFTDAESSDVDAAALAERLDGVTVTPLLTGSLTSGVEDGRDYLSLMRTNAERIVAGSGGDAG